MPLADKYSNLKYYSKYLGRKSISFHCPQCGLSILPKQFEDHCTQMHHLNSKHNCVWCWGKTSWKPGKKRLHAAHLLKCFKQFIAPSQIPVVQESVDPVPVNLDKILCVSESFFDHDASYIRNCLPSEALRTFSILPVDPLPLTYDHENLDLAASYVQKYLDTRDTHDWFHIMVKAVVFEKFVNAIKEDNGISGLLPFSCWCDGGPYYQIGHRQHRHMIAVAPEGHFEKAVWKKVFPNEKSQQNFKSKKIVKIENPLHLVNTLGYLSKRESRCRNVKNLNNNNHFYIFKTLPVSYKFPLVTLWNDGVTQLLYQEKFKNVSVSRLAETTLTRDGLQWKQKIKDFYDFERGLVLPVAKRFAPTDKDTPYFRYLAGGRKIYFEPSEVNERLDRNTWLQKQVQGGNCFYDAIGEEMWIPRLRDQMRLNDLMPRVHRIQELELENTSLKDENTTLKEEIESLKEKIIKMLQQRIKELQNENLFLRSIILKD